MYSRTPVWTCQISSPSENPSTRYLLPNFVDFVDNVIDKNSKRHCLWMQRIQRHPHILPRIKHETVAVGEGVPTISKVFCRICENLIGRSGHDWISDVREQSNVVCEIHNKSASSSHITKHPTTHCTTNLQQSVAIAVRALGTHCRLQDSPKPEATTFHRSRLQNPLTNLHDFWQTSTPFCFEHTCSHIWTRINQLYNTLAPPGEC